MGRTVSTLAELLVPLAILGVMASIFRESDRHVRCYDNLIRLSAGLREYAAADGHNYPATCGNPGASASIPAPLDLSVANSANHDRSGQNVLYADGHAEFYATCYCGTSSVNTYRALHDRSDTTGPTSVPAVPSGLNGRGIVSLDLAPSWHADSYLVPSASDAAQPPSHPHTPYSR